MLFFPSSTSRRSKVPGTLLIVLLLHFQGRLCQGQENKRGLGANDNFLINSVNASWGYDWSISIDSGGLNGEFVPMAWNGANASGWTNRFNQIDSSGAKYVLGFNEPELVDQSNMTAANAVAQWANLSDRYGFPDSNGQRAVKLVSPAVSDTGAARAWLAEFMEGAEQAGHVVDEIAFHFYSGSSASPQSAANLFLRRVEEYHEAYNRNIWITEFGGIDYGNNFSGDYMQQWNRDFLDIVLPVLDSRDYVTRYAWWNHNNDTRLAVKNAYGLFRPTKVGDPYVGTLETGDTKDLNGSGVGLEMQYLRGGSLVNNGADLGNGAVGRLYAVRDYDSIDTGAVNTNLITSQFGGSSDWGFNNWGSVTVDEYARLQKVGTGTVTMRNIDIYNDGEIHLAGGAANAGTLNISGAGTNALGTGTIRLSSNTSLVLGDAADTAGFILPYDMIYSGGSVTVDAPGIVLTGEGTITNQTTFWVNEDFTIDGNFVGNQPGLVKRGAATMTLNGDNMYLGFTNINDGTLSINGFHGGNDILINNGGTLAGTGTLVSDIVARDGGIVTPGNGIGTLTAANAEFAAGSTLSFELLSITEFDKLVLSGTLDMSPDAIVELILVDSYQPLIGDTFKLFDFNSMVGSFGSVVAPTLSQGVWDFRDLGTTGTLRVVAVPEPMSLGFLLIGSVVVAGVYRRRRR
ncbi:Extracellular serine protease precursor [Rubripirellula tenax]|uniref:Extracellular serine protease n=1 Tax=Rubripirellula tenax TaxID=2528015 RepID=A0A5C6FG99_9BACT|nr:glycosyl hydrolase [Rubripirellula tenax]TWU59855.1 Extracellular serine protease precursor [Rubripirellula tenax]